MKIEIKNRLDDETKKNIKKRIVENTSLIELH